MKIATSELEHLREEVKNCHCIIKDLQKKREFVGLTDEEAVDCWPGLAMYADCAKFWENIEAKLKAKNEH